MINKLIALFLSLLTAAGVGIGFTNFDLPNATHPQSQSEEQGAIKISPRIIFDFED